jgi:acyl-CoA thioester hydrolase
MLDDFRHQTALSVRFADLDALGHVNHAVALSYAEHARIRYMVDVCGWSGDWESFGLILARVEADYHLPLHFGDEIVVHTRCSRLGGKSFDLSYAVARVRGGSAPEVAVSARTVLVTYNYRAGASQPIPPEWVARIRAYEHAL